MTSLEEAFAELVQAAQLVRHGFLAASGSSAPLTAESHEALARAIERVPAFSAVVRTAVSLDPEQAHLQSLPEEHLERTLRHLRPGDIENNVKTFLRESRFCLSLWKGLDLDPGMFANALASAMAQKDVRCVQLVPLDGLHIRDDASLDLGEVGLVKLDLGDWERIYGTDLFHRPHIPLVELAGLWCLKRERRTTLGFRISFLSPRAQVFREFGRWLYAVNLLGLGTISPVGLFEQVDSPLAAEPVRELVVTRPAIETVSAGWDDDTAEMPVVTVEVAESADELRTFLVSLADGFRAAEGDGRILTAFRFFGRACEGLAAVKSHYIGYVGDEVLEDIVADYCTSLEAAILPPKDPTKRQTTKKGEPIGVGVAQLVGPDEAERKKVKDEVIDAYNTRNAIVHGDAQLPTDKLSDVAKVLRLRTRQVLTALLRLHGDRTMFKRAETDPAVASALRAQLRTYRDLYA